MARAPITKVSWGARLEQGLLIPPEWRLLAGLLSAEQGPPHTLSNDVWQCTPFWINACPYAHTCLEVLAASRPSTHSPWLHPKGM
jgi:hypothetical protein